MNKMEESDSTVFRALRVSQIDAVQLDKELYDIFREKFHDLIQTLKLGLLYEYEAELNVLLRTLLWKISIDANGATFGQRLLDLRYVHNDVTESRASAGAVGGLTRRFRLLYGLAIIGHNWLGDRLTDWTYERRASGQNKKVLSLLEFLCGLWNLASLLNLLIFIQRGKYVTLWERLFSIRSVHARRQQLVRSSQGYQYLTRELLWHSFADILFFIIPLINAKQVKHRLRMLLPLPDSRRRTRKREDFSRCGLCEQIPVLPHEFGCVHVFCYYCLEAYLDGASSMTCVRCGFKTDQIRQRLKSVSL